MGQLIAYEWLSVNGTKGVVISVANQITHDEGHPGLEGGTCGNLPASESRPRSNARPCSQLAFCIPQLEAWGRAERILPQRARRLGGDIRRN